MKAFLICSGLFFLVISFSLSAESSEKSNRRLIVGISESPPFVMKNDSLYYGICIELWGSIANRLGYDYEYREYDEEGLFNALKNAEVDLSINPVTVTSERLKYVHFTQPFFVTNLGIAVKTQQNSTFMVFISNFFSLSLLKIVVFLFLIILLFGVIVWLVEREKNNKQFSKGIHGIGDGIWWSAVTMTTVGYGDKAPKTALGRLFSIIWMFTAVIVVSSFTASFASSLTIHRLSNEINSIEDLRKVKVGVLPMSASAELLDEFSIRYKGYGNLIEGLTDLNEGRLGAFVFDEAILSYTITCSGLEDDLMVIPSPYTKEYFGFVSSNSDLINVINPVLISQIESKHWKATLKDYNLDDD